MQTGSEAAREKAWAECYTRYRDFVWGRVLYVIRTIPWLAEPREVAEDVTSEVFVGLPEAARHYREEGRAEQWLKQVAVRTALRARERLTGDWNRQAGSDRSRVPRMHLSFDNEADAIVAYLDEVKQDELLELERRIDVLRSSRDPRRARWVEFIELYRDGYGFAEIGDRLGITAGTARNWLVEIRRELADPANGGGSDE